MTPITISGVVVDAADIIDSLSAKIAEQALENAVLRAQVRLYAGLAQAHVVDGAPTPDRASGGTTEGSPETGWPLTDLHRVDT